MVGIRTIAIITNISLSGIKYSQYNQCWYIYYFTYNAYLVYNRALAIGQSRIEKPLYNFMSSWNTYLGANHNPKVNIQQINVFRCEFVHNESTRLAMVYIQRMPLLSSGSINKLTPEAREQCVSYVVLVSKTEKSWTFGNIEKEV